MAKLLLEVKAILKGWGKSVVTAKDTPGFIVNRVARPYYGEALRIYEEGIADFATIDWAMKEFGGFRMGPFELMDYIEALENALDKKAEKIFLPLQPGDLPETYADVNDLVDQFNYKPSTTVEEGISRFINWYREYYES